MELSAFKKPDECKGCPLFGHSHVPYTKGLSNKIALIVQSPGRDEVLAQRILVGQSGQLLNRVFKLVGIDRSQFFLMNTLKCYEGQPPPIPSDLHKAINQCHFFLDRALKVIQPRLLILSGAYALKSILGKEKITDKRGNFYWSAEYNCPCFVTLHPSAILRECDKNYPNQPFEMMSMREKDFVKDWQTIATILARPNEDIEAMYWELKEGQTMDIRKFLNPIDITGYIEGKEKILKTFSKMPVISFDIEKESSDPKSDPLSIAFSVKDKESHVFFINKKIPMPLKQILKSKVNKVVMARPFDEEVLRRWYKIKVGGKIYDVATMAHVLDENYYAFNLENIAAIWADMKDIKNLSEGMRENLKDAEPHTVIVYNGVDSDATLRSFEKMLAALDKEPKLRNYYEHFMIPVQNMQSAIVNNGGRIDRKKYYKNIVIASDEMKRMETALIQMIPAKVANSPAHKGDLRLSRDNLLRDVIFKALKCKPNPNYLTKVQKLPQVSKEHLKDFEHIPFVKNYLEWAELEKIYSSYLAPLDKFIQEDDHIYPATLMTRTVTGRTAMLHPPMQTYPIRSKWAKLIRGCVCADPGWLLGERDSSQSELRIAGWLANDTNILKALHNGIDLHTLTAAIINKLPVDKVTKEMRRDAKPINFGLIYGLSAKSLKAYLWEKYNIRASQEECDRIRKLFFSYPNGYHGLPPFYERIKAELRSKGYVESVLGRRRRFPMAKNNFDYLGQVEWQAVNFPIQSFSSDLALIGMMLFHQTLTKHKMLDVVKLMWFIHDSIIFQAKKGAMTEAMNILQRCMDVEAPAYVKKYFGVTLGYPVESEGAIGETWEDLG